MSAKSRENVWSFTFNGIEKVRGSTPLISTTRKSAFAPVKSRVKSAVAATLVFAAFAALADFAIDIDPKAEPVRQPPQGKDVFVTVDFFDEMGLPDYSPAMTADHIRAARGQAHDRLAAGRHAFVLLAVTGYTTESPHGLQIPNFSHS